jgi:hypothetical protein
MGLIEEKINNFIESLNEEQVSLSKEILFHFANKDLINKVKKIYEQPTGTNTDDIASDISE